MRFWLFIRVALLKIRCEKWKAKSEMLEKMVQIAYDDRNEAIKQHYETLRRLLK